MRRRRLGRHGPVVSALGYGLMSLSGVYGPARTDESLDAMRAALEVGIDFFDTAEGYGGGHNEELAARLLTERRDEIVVATKFGLVFEQGRIRADGTPRNARRALEGSLARLGVDTIDLYYLHRRDPDVPIEETVGAMARFVEEGKVRFLGLSAVSSETLRRAHAVHPICAVQSEYSLWTRDPERSVLPTCDELGVGFVPYSPLGRGMLAGGLTSRAALTPEDVRTATPYFDPEHFEHNRALAGRLADLAREAGTTPAALALAWLLHRGPSIVPLFGTRRRANLEENARGADLDLDAATLGCLETLFPPGAASGDPAPRVTAHLDEH